jgi:hypothetical protein
MGNAVTPQSLALHATPIDKRPARQASVPSTTTTTIIAHSHHHHRHAHCQTTHSPPCLTFFVAVRATHALSFSRMVPSAECLEWSSRYLHLRSVGAQLCPERDHGIAESVPPPVGVHTDLDERRRRTEQSRRETPWAGADLGSLAVGGRAAAVHPPEGQPASAREEVFAQHGEVEEYFARDYGYSASGGEGDGAGPAVGDVEDIDDGADLDDAREAAALACAEQALDDFWEDVATMLLPLADALTNAAGSKARYSHVWSPADADRDGGGAGGGGGPSRFGPLNHRTLESLSQVQLGTAPTQIRLTVVGDDAPPLGMGSGAPRRTHSSNASADAGAGGASGGGGGGDQKIEGLSSAITIRGLSNPHIAAAARSGLTVVQPSGNAARQPQWSPPQQQRSLVPRPMSGRPASGRPVSGRVLGYSEVAGGRPGSGRPASGAVARARQLGPVRPASASRRVGSAVTRRTLPPTSWEPSLSGMPAAVNNSNAASTSEFRHSYHERTSSSIVPPPTSLPRPATSAPRVVGGALGSGQKQPVPARPHVVLLGASATLAGRVGTPARASTPGTRLGTPNERRSGGGGGGVTASVSFDGGTRASSGRGGADRGAATGFSMSQTAQSPQSQHRQPQPHHQPQQAGHTLHVLPAITRGNNRPGSGAAHGMLPGIGIGRRRSQENRLIRHDSWGAPSRV